MLNNGFLSNDDARPRALAYSLEKQASYQPDRNKRIDLYKQALIELSHIKAPTDADIRLGALISFYLGDAHFNKLDFNAAVYHYLESIAYLEQIKSQKDDDFRQYVKLFINLSDAYTEMKPEEASAKGFSKEEAAFQSFSNAMIAYNKISLKTDGEMKNIGAQVKKGNQQIFRDFFEEDLSSAKYFNIDSKENAKKIYLTQEDNKLVNTATNQLYIEMQPDNLLHSVNSLNVTPTFSPLPKPPDADMCNMANMMDSMSVDSSAPENISASNSASSNMSMASNRYTLHAPPPSDDISYRDTGNKKLQLAQQQHTDGSIFDAITYYREAFEEFSKIQRKGPSDHEILNIINLTLEKINQNLSIVQGQSAYRRYT
jgi:hypothetical protein